MTFAARLALAGLLFAPLAATAGEATAPAKGQLLGSCRVSDLSCTDYEKAVGPGARDACIKFKLTWSDAPCPAARRVATCVTREGAGRAFTQSYPPSTPAIAKQACDNTPGGVFVK